MLNKDLEMICKQIVENAPEAVIFADSEGIIRLWNTGAELIFGYSNEEALGHNLDLIIPEQLRQRHWDGYRKVMDTGVTRYAHQLLAVPALARGRHKNLH